MFEIILFQKVPTKEQINKEIGACTIELGIKDHVVDYESTPTRKLLKCAFTKTGLINKDGLFDYDNIKASLRHFSDKEAATIATFCLNIPHNDKLAYVGNVTKCIQSQY